MLTTKRIFTISLFFILNLGISYSQNSNLNNSFIKLKKGIYVSKTEVSNNEYELFLNDYGRNNLNQVNSNGWVQGEEFKYSFFIPFKEFYQTDRKYKRHPAVNIYQDAAKMYCNWVTDNYNSKLDSMKQKVKFRLPTISEWKMLSKHANMVKIKDERLKFNPLPKNKKADSYNSELEKAKRGKILQDSKLMGYLLSDEYVDVFTTWPVDYYFEINPEVKHIYGNVSEWTSEPNIAIGGNWTTTEENEVTDTLFCNSYSPKIGFRVVMEFIK